MTTITPYLVFDGHCEAAFKFYAQCLGVPLVRLLRFSEMPCDNAPPMPPEAKDRIMHTSLAVDGQMLMGSDTMPGQAYEGIKGCSVSLGVDSVADAERLFGALSEGGTVTMPLSPTFWATRFGMFTDRFGVAWMINCEAQQG